MNSVRTRVVCLFRLCFVLVGVMICVMPFLQISYIRRIIPIRDQKFNVSDLRSLQSLDTPVVVLVFSHRDSFSRREQIRRTWAEGHTHVYFMVSELYCPHPPENRISGKCIPKGKSVNGKHVQKYLAKEEAVTRKLRNESNVVLLHNVDVFEDLHKKVNESLTWVIRKVNARWIIFVEDSMDVKLGTLERYLLSEFDETKITVLIALLKCESALDIGKRVLSCNSSLKPDFFTLYPCAFNHIVSRQYVAYLQNGGKHIFHYIDTYNGSTLRVNNSPFIQSVHREEDPGLITMNEKRNSTGIIILDLSFKPNTSCVRIRKVKSSQENETVYTLSENPSNYLHSDRFDLIVKMVYAYYYVLENRVPLVIQAAYIEHLRVWNHFKEGCNLRKTWYDAKIACTAKHNSSDFLASFHNTIETIKKYGFNSSMSRIPVDRDGFLNNGAHRTSASVILSKNATFEHHTFKQHSGWGYKHFKSLGMSVKSFNVVMLEWMKIQMKLPYLNTFTFIVSVFSNNRKKDMAMRKIVKEMCSKDNGILYEITINISKQGARQLISHMYGEQSWLEAKIQQMQSKFNSTYNVLFLFVYAKGTGDLVQCKHAIRKLYNDKVFKSTAHIPDNPEENLILSEMILNPNSLHFMNHAKNVSDCKLIAKEVASRSSIAPISTLPGICVGRDDVMIDSGTVLGFFGLRKRTDVDLLFLHKVDKALLGNDHGISIQAHAFKNNSISKERAWGEDHFSDTGPKDQWDLFYDPINFGYCYGIKFVSLKQLVRYKMKRKEPKKDAFDVELINSFWNTTSINH
ncbi:uncharacterized protein LOC123524936 [Mercenaria mercenaria]|uniref:uncharacterized protein LOC123524936 n=1 Tax=Mercenaria mercenaria TaxID=6596 RepID=UPI00234E8418|nr:uncharacterized protein LOC123524936 [Mercenaria mercenaria]